MTYLYIDGINHLHLQDGTIRGTLVVLQPHFETLAPAGSEDTLAKNPRIEVSSAGTLMTSIRGALQMHAALDQLIKKLIENKVLQADEAADAKLTAELTAKDNELQN